MMAVKTKSKPEAGLVHLVRKNEGYVSRISVALCNQVWKPSGVDKAKRSAPCLECEAVRLEQNLTDVKRLW